MYQNAFPQQKKEERKKTNPKDTDGVERAVRWGVGFNHAEHAVELPVDEENNKEMVGVPETLKVSPTPLLHRKPDHNPQGEPHDPPRDPRPGCEVGQQKDNEPLLGRICRRNSEICKVKHVGNCVDDGPEDDGPGGGLVEGDVLVEGDDVVQGCPTQHGDEVPAYGEQDEGGIDVQNEGSSTGNG